MLYNYTFSFASLKSLTNSGKAFLLRIPFSVIGRCSPVPLAAGKIYLSRAASGHVLEYHRRLPVCIFMADLGSLKKVDKKGFSK
jgi:hypothetical protein